MTHSSQDQGTSKSRDALIAAFEALVVSKPYQEISVGNIVNKADVGRSTFYDHFANKDALLRQSLLNVVNLLATAVSPKCDIDHLAHILEHFKEVGDVAKAFFNGPGQEQFTAALQESVLEQMPATDNQQIYQSTDDACAFSARLVAETMVAMTRAWLSTPAPCSAADLARRMHRAALAIR